MIALRLYMTLAILPFSVKNPNYSSILDLNSGTRAVYECESSVVQGTIVRYMEYPNKNLVHPPVWNYLFIDSCVISKMYCTEAIDGNSFLNHMINNESAVLGLFRYYKDLASCCGDADLSADSMKLKYLDLSNEYRTKYFEEAFEQYSMSWSYSNRKYNYYLDGIRIKGRICKCPLVINERLNYYVNSSIDITLVYPIDIVAVGRISSRDSSYLESTFKRYAAPR